MATDSLGPGGDVAAPDLDLYRQMVLIRRAEELIAEHYAEDEMKTPVHLCIGQEAVATGVCSALAPGDQVVATYRNHGVYLALSDDPEGLFGELYGRISGPARGKAGSMHLSRPDRGLVFTSAVVGSTIPLSLGLAYANKLQQPGRIAVAFFGDGAMDEGCFWESLNFACLKRLPVLFVCEDNSLAIHTRAEERRGYRSVARVVSGFDCIVEASESTDAVEIRQLAQAVLTQVRSGRGPGFLHLRCYRYAEHVGPRIEQDFHLGFRDPADHANWMARDPLERQKSRLLDSGASKAALEDLEKSVDARLRRARAEASASPLPPADELWTDVDARSARS